MRTASHNLTVLRAPVFKEGGEDTIVDIVAVHGLDEDKFEAWTDTDTGKLWLRDLLDDEDFPINVNILTFGYKADSTSLLGSSSSERISSCAHTLVADLEAERQTVGASKRPIIFVCHGLGGILVKQALAHSSTRVSHYLKHLRSIFLSTYGIIFLGTPHNGIDQTSWPLMAKDMSGVLEAPSKLLTSINRDSGTLQNITDQFAPLAKQFHINFFWEELETDKGSFRGYVVSEDSAAPIWGHTERSGIYANHSQMCKFRDKDAPGYNRVRVTLARYVRAAKALIDHRWTIEEGITSQDSKNPPELQPQAYDAHQNNKPFSLLQPQFGKIQNKYFRLPHTVSSIFTGREEIAKGLQEKILGPSEKSTPLRQKRFVLYGLGGSGKTQFCLKFAQDNRDRFWGIFWIDASSAKSAERTFSELGRLGEMEEKFESGMYWLAGLEMPWLLVIDNADDLEFDYSRYFPSGDRGHILVTSRNPECRIHATIGYHEFKEMEEEEGVTLLLKAAREKDPYDRRKRALAKPVAKELGYLPLALIQAGASIRRFCPLEEYLEVFALQKRAILSASLGQDAEDYKYTIYTTWEVSFQKIEREATQVAADAIAILHILAFLHFDQIPATIFERAWNNIHDSGKLQSTKSLLERLAAFDVLAPLVKTYEMLFPTSEPQLPRILLQKGSKWDKLRFRQALGLLSSYSLIFQDVSKESYSMHPMVHFWARDRLQVRDQKVWAEVTRRTIAHSIDEQKGTKNTLYRRSLIPHIESCFQGEDDEGPPDLTKNNVRLDQTVKFASVYSEGGRWQEAQSLQRQILDIQKNTFGQDNPKTLKVMSELAWSYWNLSQMGKALPLQREVLDLSLRTLGPHDPMTLRAMDSLGRTCWLSGDATKAEELGRQAFKGMDLVLGSDHPYTLSAEHNLARACMHRGRPKEAQSMQLEVLKARAKMLGVEHFDTLETMADLGMSYFALGQVKEAEALVANVREARSRILGQEHGYTLWSNNDLAKIYCEQGYGKEAEEMLIKTRDIITRTLGNEHIGMFMTLFNLAHAYFCQQQWVKAEDVLSGLIDVEIRKLGPLHPDVLAAKAELGRVYLHQGRLQAAETVLVEVTEAMEKKIGPEHPRTLKVKSELSSIRDSAASRAESQKGPSSVAEGGITPQDNAHRAKRLPHRSSTA